MKYSILFILQTLALFSAPGAEPAARPNILYLFVDDMGWGSIGPNGQAAVARAGDPASSHCALHIVIVMNFNGRTPPHRALLDVG